MTRFELSAADSALLLIDVQERFVPVIPAVAEDQPVGKVLKQLLTGAQLLGVPTIISEQYPKGLGTTLPYLSSAAPGAERLAKMHFSCGEDPALRARLDALHRTHVVLCGIETHVCVLHTAADLLAQGRGVVVVADAVASRKDQHRDLALQALRDLGALLLPAESVLMRWTRVAGTPVFRQISALIK
jgi:nicotinamidase-related amidase